MYHFILISSVVLTCSLSADRLKTNSSAREHARGSDAAAQSRLMMDLFNVFKVSSRNCSHARPAHLTNNTVKFNES